MVFDGEVCIVDENGVEDFQGIMKEIKRKDHTIKNPKYKVFDYLM
jgi:ATP-dependent DNA ligase